MDHVEELLRETLNEAAGQAPAAHGVPDLDPPRLMRGRGFAIAAVAVVVAAAAVAVPVALDHGALGRDQAAGHPSGPTVTSTEPPGAPMQLFMGVYLSPDRRTLYAPVTESIANRGAYCWTYVDGIARPDETGVATVRLTQHTRVQTMPTLPPGQAYGCPQPAVPGPYYSRITLDQPYDKPYVIDGRSGKRLQVLGTVQPRADRIVNWP